ncbi:MAG: FAD-dependent oxidoreductase [Balneolaceae bacterium]|nr:FAD-dependent oxidoreductase [Balneolaceae bacterium]
MKKVVVLGGGVAGMSAAHELSERGFSVEVYEHKEHYCGGKARSVDVPGTGTDGRKPLPGEHGFRFFPGFYKHVTDTMKRIPVDGKKTAFDNLVPTETITLGRYDKKPFRTLAHFPKNIAEAEFLVKNLFGSDLGLTREEEIFFGQRVWQLMTSCKERRINEYEGLGWWEYLQADRFSKAYQTLLVEGLTRTLVAAKAKTASTKTGGDIFLQLIYNTINPFVDVDRVLNAPTNDAWLTPWYTYLTEKLGVKYHFSSTVEEIKLDNREIDYVTVNKDGDSIKVTGDYYIFAVPVERMAPLINNELLKTDGTLATIKKLAPSVSWMNGLQVYLNEDVKISRGHVICSDSEWAITCISQPQFWPDVNLEKYGDGTVKGIISVDISDWFTEGTNGKAACNCTKQEIFDEVWIQLKKSLNTGATVPLKEEMVMDWFLDSDIEIDEKPFPEPETPGNASYSRNREPLLVNRVNTWSLRPEPYTNIPNLFLASDYVKTNTDLATMEGANEAARKAVNAIIQASGSNKKMCEIWDLHEPLILSPLRWADKKRYEKGLPWHHEHGLFSKLLLSVTHLFAKVVGIFNRKR